MRFGIGATSGIRPKLLRMRLRPVNDVAIDAPRIPAIPRGRTPSRQTKIAPAPPEASSPLAWARSEEGSKRQWPDGTAFAAPRPVSRPATGKPAAGRTRCVLLELDGRTSLLELLLDLVGLVLVDAFLDG